MHVRNIKFSKTTELFSGGKIDHNCKDGINCKALTLKENQKKPLLYIIAIYDNQKNLTIIS